MMGPKFRQLYPVAGSRRAGFTYGLPGITDRVLAGLAMVLALLAVYWLRIADPDLWGHLRYGRFFLENGLRSADPFAYTTAGQTWYMHEYLAQIVLWLTYDTGGAGGLIVLKCALGVGVLALHGVTLRGLGDQPRIWAPLLALDAVLLGSYFFFRPQLFTFLGMACFVWLVFRHLAGHRSPLWILPFVAVLWANLHGGFVAGIGALGLGLALRVIQVGRGRGSWQEVLPLAAALAGCMVASLATPLGARIWRFLAIELTNPYNHRFIGEWRPVRLAAPGTDGWALLVLVAVALLAWWLAELRGGELHGLRPWQWLVSCLPLFLLAFRAHRQIPLVALWCGPVVALLAAAALAPRRSILQADGTEIQTAASAADGQNRRWPRWGHGLARWAADAASALSIWRLAMLLAFVPAVGVAVSVLLDPLPRIRIVDQSLGRERPTGAVAFMRENGLAGNLYLPLWWGSYATWELFPSVRVSMDGRNDTAYPVELVGENLRFYAVGHEATAPLRHDTDFLLVPSRCAVLTELETDARWRLIYRDRDALLFVRSQRTDLAPSVARAPRQEADERSSSDLFE